MPKERFVEYGKYLNDQLKASANKELKKQYHSYIVNQIALNDKRIAAIDVKIK